MISLQQAEIFLISKFVIMSYETKTRFLGWKARKMKKKDVFFIICYADHPYKNREGVMKRVQFGEFSLLVGVCKTEVQLKRTLATLTGEDALKKFNPKLKQQVLVDGLSDAEKQELPWHTNYAHLTRMKNIVSEAESLQTQIAKLGEKAEEAKLKYIGEKSAKPILQLLEFVYTFADGVDAVEDVLEIVMGIYYAELLITGGQQG